MPNQTDVEVAFRALSDPTRRAIVERLGTGDATTTQLAAPFSMALPSLLQHLDVLERSGIVQSTKHGRVRTYRLRPDPFASIESWLDEQRRQWETRLDQLDALLERRTEQP